MEVSRHLDLFLLKLKLVLFAGELLGETGFLTDGKLGRVEAYLVRLYHVPQVFISVCHWKHLRSRNKGKSY